MNTGATICVVALAFGIPMFIAALIKWNRDDARERREREQRQALHRRQQSPRQPSRRKV